MVVPFVSMPLHLFQAEHATQSQNILQNATANQAAVASDRTKDIARQEESQLIAETQEAEDLTIEPEGRGSHAHTLAERSEEEEAETQEQKQAPQAPDPTGRGTVLDLNA